MIRKLAAASVAMLLWLQGGAAHAASEFKIVTASERGTYIQIGRNLAQFVAPQADIDLAAHWVLGRPETFLLTSGDVEILPRLLDAVDRFEQRPSDAQMAELTARREVAALFV